MTPVSARKARKYFEAKLDFTTGPVELSDMIKRDENINIIDVRKSDDYAMGHIPRAVNLPEGSWNAFTGLSKDRLNVIYCYSEVCHLAASAAKFFADHDFPVMELEGGYDHWQRYDLPVEI